MAVFESNYKDDMTREEAIDLVARWAGAVCGGNARLRRVCKGGGGGMGQGLASSTLFSLPLGEELRGRYLWGRGGARQYSVETSPSSGLCLHHSAWCILSSLRAPTTALPGAVLTCPRHTPLHPQGHQVGHLQRPGVRLERGPVCHHQGQDRVPAQP